MRKTSIGRRLYLGIIAIFLLFAVAFMAFQQNREKQFKINALELRLQLFNKQIAEVAGYRSVETKAIENYLKTHTKRELRITLIRPNGKVVFDNAITNFRSLSNHQNRPEVRQALKNGYGSVVERQSTTIHQEYFYSATYFPHQELIVRSALPYSNDLISSLQADFHYVWFTLVVFLLLTLVLYRFVRRLDRNIENLKIFAERADSDVPIRIEELADFPNDELGEIAERIIKIYKRLKSTRQEQDILKKELTQNISHELKTPVASIQGYLETILNNPQVTKENQDDFLRRCYAQTERLSSLLHDIAMLNRLEDATNIQEKTDINVASVIHEIKEDALLRLEEKKMEVLLMLPEQIIIHAANEHIHSIFRNLFDNAIAYAGIGTTITLSAERSEAGWQFIFADNGQGVEHKHLSRIFERFYRIDKGRSRKLGGTGLGLAIVKNTVLAYGGHIEAQHNEPQGLKFVFTLQT